MIWFIIFGSIALLGLIVAILLLFWLGHKVSDLLSEVEMLGKRAEELAKLVEGLDFEQFDRVMEPVD